jgi:hypothetical protein
MQAQHEPNDQGPLAGALGDLIPQTHPRPKKRVKSRPRRIFFGLFCGIVAASCSVYLFVSIVLGHLSWWLLLPTAVALGLGSVGAFIGIMGVIRFGLFTEGNSGSEVRHELHLGKLSYWAGGLSQAAFMFTICSLPALIVVLIV